MTRATPLAFVLAAFAVACSSNGVGFDVGESLENECNDLDDNDSDGLVDCKDPGCAATKVCIAKKAPRDASVSAPRPDTKPATAKPDSGGPPWPVCARATGEAKLVGGGVDIIWFVDNSGSMAQETAWVSQNLNAFAKFITGKSLDFRVVMISRKGATRLRVCVPPPLGGANCADGPRYQHVDVTVSSTDGLQKIIDMYPAYQKFLRPSATKNFVAVTDDESRMTVPNFLSALGTLKSPGFPPSKLVPQGFVFHSIVAFGPTPGRGCATGARIGHRYLDLTNMTMGAKFQVCLSNWAPIFNTLAKNVAQTAKPPCKYKLPTPPKGQTINPKQVVVTYIDKDGKKRTVPRVTNSAACGTKQAYHYVQGATLTEIVFCPEMCKSMKAGKIQIAFGCLKDIG